MTFSCRWGRCLGFGLSRVCVFRSTPSCWSAPVWSARTSSRSTSTSTGRIETTWPSGGDTMWSECFVDWLIYLICSILVHRFVSPWLWFLLAFPWSWISVVYVDLWFIPWLKVIAMRRCFSISQQAETLTFSYYFRSFPNPKFPGSSLWCWSEEVNCLTSLTNW